MKIFSRGLARDAAILVALVLIAALAGQALGAAWKQWREPNPVERFDANTFAAEHLTSPVMIASSTCPACAKARVWLAEHSIDYQELTVDTSASARAIAERLQVKTVPTFLIGDVRINGFVEAELKQRLTSSMTAKKN